MFVRPEEYDPILTFHIATWQPSSLASDESETKAKLRVLEAHRATDAQRMRDLEARLTEAEAFVSFKPKLQAKLQTLQSEAATYKRELADMKIEQKALEDKVAELGDQLEMAALDREMAEERAEGAEADAESEKERRAELEVELGVFKQQAGSGSATSDGDEGTEVEEGDTGAKTTMEYIQLEKQNERLKEALIR